VEEKLISFGSVIGQDLFDLGYRVHPCASRLDQTKDITRLQRVYLSSEKCPIKCFSNGI